MRPIGPAAPARCRPRVSAAPGRGGANYFRKAALAFGLLAAAAAAPALERCRLPGVEHDALCGRVARPLDPARPAGPTIDVHYAVLPAVARQKLPDPLFVFAGGPGQSAVALAEQATRLFGRFLNRRDIVLVDQRGTGRSAPLACPGDDDPLRPLADAARQEALLAGCRAALQQLPHGDLRFYATALAVQDVEAVRAALGAERINLWGASYGTRAALEYQRQFPQRVRRAVLDGVAPPDMVLPASQSPDAQAVFDALLAACQAEAPCRARHPRLAATWQALLASLPREVSVPHPLTGARERITLTRDLLLALVRTPLYAPALAAALPEALARAAEGDDFAPLVALASGVGGGRRGAIASGMHFSVVCAEDLARAPADAPGADFGSGFLDLYRRVCADWPRGAVPAGFYSVPAAPAPVLLLSGALDPATPPRHGARVAQALGPRARHVVVPNAGHGVTALGCVRDLVFRFVDAGAEADALALDTTCAAALPRPPAFVPPGGVR